MSFRSAVLPKVKTPPQEIVVVMLLGTAGLIINTFGLPLGWGVYFLFGNALIYACVRLLTRRALLLAISISSLWTIFLFGHPWAWLLCVCEAIFVAVYARITSPVRISVIFWLGFGGPLILFIFGAVLKMELLPLALLIFKLAANGIFNVVLGELIYLALIAINPMQKCSHWPKLKLESVIITFLMAVILVPITVYLALDAPVREKAARQDVGRSLEYQLRVSGVALNSWVQSRSLVLRIYAEQQIDGNGEANQEVIKDLSSEFADVELSGQGQTSLSSVKTEGEPMQQVAQPPNQNPLLVPPGPHLTSLPQRIDQRTQFGLVVPFKADGKARFIVAELREDVLKKLISGFGKNPEYGIFLVGPEQEVLSLSPDQASLRAQIKGLPAAERMASLRSPVLLSNVSSTQAAMSDLGRAHIVRSSIITELPGWQAFAVAPLAPAVAKARQIQLRQFAALIVFVLLITVIASALSLRLSQTLRRLSKSASDLAASGAPREPVGSVVIDEVNEISGGIATAGTTMGQERGALASAHRRLNNIAQQAPVIVYALDVMENGEGNLVYVSDSLEKIMGYTPAETHTPGWWIRSIHPDDTHTRSEAFSLLSPDKLVNIEYRVRHKSGHYVWVWDSLLVETNSHTGKLEGNGVIMDISERKAAAEQLLQADKMASLGRMISGTAHELNQPLNFIKMAASNLRENTARGQMDADRFLPKLENVLQQVERASAILLQMRIFGRTASEPAHPLNVKTAIEAVMGMVTPQLDLDGTKVTIFDRGEGVHVQALPMLLEQVLLNLILNANHAIQMRYDSGDTAEGRIDILLERHDKFATITVEDNGTGIPPDVLQKIFDPFFTTKPPKEGTGLGLSISYGIIHDLGGVISARSSPYGARFIIELPITENVSALAM